MKYNILFNFSISYSGGGLKRLCEFSQWFNENGGAHFLIHEKCLFLIERYNNNKYTIVRQSYTMRMFNDCGYLSRIIERYKIPSVYYSYGIPIYKKIAEKNWFHLSNILPLYCKEIELPLTAKLKMYLLGRRIIKNFKNADIISAESKFSLNAIEPHNVNRLFLSVNGSDDELNYLNNFSVIENLSSNIAVVVGTYSYKMVEDAILVFDQLKVINSNLRLFIIGDVKYLSRYIKKRSDVVLLGNLDRSSVIDYLKIADYYISTTIIENSYNAASEGVFLAKKSYISDIQPHRELLGDVFYQLRSIKALDKKIIEVSNSEAKKINVKRWNEIIIEMLNEVNL